MSPFFDLIMNMAETFSEECRLLHFLSSSYFLFAQAFAVSEWKHFFLTVAMVSNRLLPIVLIKKQHVTETNNDKDFTTI